MKIVAILTACLLAGCSSFTPPPPATPSVVDVTTEQQNIAAFKGQPVDYLNTGVELSNTWCNTYLNALVQNVSTTDFEASSTTQAGALATGISGVVSSSLAATTVMGMLFPAMNQTLVAAGRMATAGSDPGMVYSLIAKEHGAYLSALSAPSTVAEAVADISGYASICQPAGIRSAVLQAGLNTTVSASSSTTGGNSGPAKAVMAPMPTGINVPPVITIGR